MPERIGDGGVFQSERSSKKSIGREGNTITCKMQVFIFLFMYDATNLSG